MAGFQWHIFGPKSAAHTIKGQFPKIVAGCFGFNVSKILSDGQYALLQQLNAFGIVLSAGLA